MPAPKPNSGEEKNDFISRCIKFFHDEDSDMSDEQIQAACYDAWDKAKGRDMQFAKETRAFLTNLEIRFDEEKRPIVEGYAAVFDSLSEDLGGFREKIAPDAFDSALKNSDTYLFWNHNPDIVLARRKAGTLKLSTDKHGLRIEAKFPEWANSYLETLQRRDVSSMSFGFIAESDEWNHKDNIRTLTKIREVPEVSIVAFPAYSATNVEVALRSKELSKTSTDEAEPKLVDSDDIDGAPMRSVDNDGWSKLTFDQKIDLIHAEIRRKRSK